MNIQNISARRHARLTMILANAALLLSCSPKEPVPGLVSFGGETMELQVNAGPAPGFQDGEPSWLDGERMGVFFLKEKSLFVHDGTTGTFIGETPRMEVLSEGQLLCRDFMKAVIPYRDDMTTDGTTVRTYLPEVQEAVADGFSPGALIWAACSDAKGRVLTMSSLMGGVRFQVPVEGITRVSLRGNEGERIAGALDVTFDGDGVPQAKASQEGSGTVSLKCPSGFQTGRWYHMAILPSVFRSGFTAGFEKDGTTVEIVRDAECEIGRASLLTLEIDADAIDPDKGEVKLQDPAFMAFCLEMFDADRDGTLSKEEAQEVKSMSLQDQIARGGIRTLEGLSAFANLEYLLVDCEPRTTDESGAPLPPDRWDYNTGSLTELDLRGNASLKGVWCSGNRIREIALPESSHLEELHCAYNHLETLDLSTAGSLRFLYAENNRFSCLDVSSCPELEELSVDGNPVKSINATANTKLRALTGTKADLSEVSIKGCEALEELVLDENRIGSIDLTGCTSLSILSITTNELEALAADDLPCLSELYASGNRIAVMSAKGSRAIGNLQLADNRLAEMDLGGMPSLSRLTVSGNMLTSLDTRSNPELVTISCERNRIAALDLSGNPMLTNLRCSENLISRLDVSMLGYLTTLDCAPMNDDKGQNMLLQLFICKGQQIRNVTTNRSDKYIPAGTSIVEKAASTKATKSAVPDGGKDREFIPLRLRERVKARKDAHRDASPGRFQRNISF